MTSGNAESRPRWQGWAIAATVLVAAGWVGALVAFDPPEPDGLRRPAPIATPAAFGTERVWARGHVVHVGARRVGVGQWFVRELHPSAYGVFVGLVLSPGSDGRPVWHFLDARGLQRVPGDVETAPVVSKDGRFATWTDRHGAWRPAGRIAQQVTVDLSTGEVVPPT